MALQILIFSQNYEILFIYYWAKMVANDFTQRGKIDYDETFSHIFMFKSFKFLCLLRLWDFANGLEDNISKWISWRKPLWLKHKVCKLLNSIYELKQTTRFWNQRFDEIIKTYGFKQNIYEFCVYMLIKGQVVIFLGIRYFGYWKQH